MKALRMTRLLRRFRRSQEGTASMEFVILFPIFMFIAFSGIEAGVLLSRQVFLEHGVSNAMRDVRLGRMRGSTVTELKRAVCNATLFLKDCMDNISIEMVPIDPENPVFPAASAPCVDRDQNIKPVTQVTQGSNNELMLVRTCIIMDTFMPGSGLANHLELDASGGYKLVSIATFVNEPTESD